MKSILKKFVFAVLMIIIAVVIFASMTVPYNGLMWILKAILFFVLVRYGFVTAYKCDIEFNSKYMEVMKQYDETKKQYDEIIGKD